MISEITHIIDEKYSKYNEKECLDIVQIKNFCGLYKSKNIPNSSNNKMTLSDIDFSSPGIDKIKKNNSKTRQNISKLNTIEFQKIYSLFIKLLYSCLKLNVDIFNEKSDNDNIFCTIKNNYQLMKSIDSCKKKFIGEHIDILKNQYKNMSTSDINSYENYIKEYLLKLQIFGRLTGWINIFEKNDNLFSLILPYFYTYTEYIEEYTG